MTKTINRLNLGALLDKSEKHAIEHSADNRTCPKLFEHQLEDGYLSMTVSTKNVKRAIRLLKEIILKFYDAGFSITVIGNSCKVPSSAVIVDGETIPFRIREKMDRQQVMKYGYPHNELVPTGIMSFELHAGFFEWKPSKVFSDTTCFKLEDRIDEMVPYLIQAVKELKEIKQRYELENQQEKEKQRLDEERKRRVEAKLQIVEYVLRDIKRYEKAKLIREYCDAIEPKVRETKYYGMLLIARSFADWINPTVDYVDEDFAEFVDLSTLFK